MTEHSRYPVPAPAIAELLKGIPIYMDQKVRAELVTPTGAVILNGLVDEFKAPILRIEKVGYGAGTRDLEIPNVLRGYLGFLEGKSERDILIETNVDNMESATVQIPYGKTVRSGCKRCFLHLHIHEEEPPGCESLCSLSGGKKRRDPENSLQGEYQY